MWAALDCPGAWTVSLGGAPILLGRLTAEVAARPAVGEPCVVMGRYLSEDGRKLFTATTAYGADGRVLGHAMATWIRLTPR